MKFSEFVAMRSNSNAFSNDQDFLRIAFQRANAAGHCAGSNAWTFLRFGETDQKWFYQGRYFLSASAVWQNSLFVTAVVSGKNSKPKSALLWHYQGELSRVEGSILEMKEMLAKEGRYKFGVDRIRVAVVLASKHCHPQTKFLAEYLLSMLGHANVDLLYGTLPTESAGSIGYGCAMGAMAGNVAIWLPDRPGLNNWCIGKARPA